MDTFDTLEDQNKSKKTNKVLEIVKLVIGFVVLLTTYFVAYSLFGLFMGGESKLFSSETPKIEIFQKGTTDTCYIYAVDDGDTVDLACKKLGIVPAVRTLGIDAPDVGTCYYDTAKKFMADLKKNYTVLNVKFFGSDLCKDPYKGCRNLATYNTRTDSDFAGDIGLQMISSGVAFAWTDFDAVPGGIAAKYSVNHDNAKDAKVGLWKACKIVEQKSARNSGVAPIMTNKIK